MQLIPITSEHVKQRLLYHKNFLLIDTKTPGLAKLCQQF
jgi:hypothetical protein